MKTMGAGKRRLAAIALLAGVTVGCVQTWRPNWWNFYERGLTRLSEEKFPEAAEDLEIATGMKKGATVPRPEDTRRARTYGLHFVDDYFPHRELGIAYYRMNRLAEAERELLVSVSQTPSAKAKSYLNLVRSELLRQKPAQDEAPELELDVPKEEVLRSDAITVAGVAHSKNYISSILVNDRRVFTELAETRRQFKEEVKLAPGVNEVSVEAVDLIGKSTRKRMRLTVDRQYPAVAIEDVARKGPNTVTVSGIATDNMGISTLVVEGEERPAGGPSTEIEFTLDAAVGDAITVDVTDLAGNRTSAKVLITADMLRPAEEGSAGAILLAMLDSDRVADAGQTPLLLSENATGNDRTPPMISLRNVVENRVIYDDEFIFDGSARDNGRLGSLTVNGEDILVEKRGVLVKYFTYRANLVEGENRFTVVAGDRAGNETKQSFTVIRKVQEPMQIAARLTLALLPLQERGAVRLATEQVYDLLLGSFLESERFNFVEREEGAFQALLTELKIANSELADKDTAVRIGRMKTAEGMLYGKTIEDQNSITVDLWLVDTETTEILFFADVYGENKSRDELKWLVDGLVLKFRQHFPLVRGKVTNVTEDGVFIDNGLVDGIGTGMKYLVLNEDPGGIPGTLSIRKVDGKSLEARVKMVRAQSCFAAFANREGVPKVAVNDPVITK
jgi:hypothetical protein